MRRLSFVAAATMAGISAVFVLLAELADRYDLTTASLGWIAGSAFGAALVSQLALARYADRGYSRLLLQVGLVFVSAGLLWFGLATELWQFIAARVVLGLGSGMIIPPARRAIILASDGDQGEKLGAFYAAYLAGFVIGPPVAGVLTELGDVRLPFLVFGTVVAISFISLRTLVIDEAPRGGVAASAADRRVVRRLLADRRMIAAILVIVSFRYSIGVFEPLWATHLDSLGASTLLISLSITGFALPMLIVAKPAGRMSDRYGPRLVSLLAALVTVPLMATYGYVGWVPLILMLAVPHGLMEALLSPGSQAAIADVVGADDTASAQGLGEAAGSAAAGIGAITAPMIFDWLGAGPAWLIAALVMLGLLTTSWLLDQPAWARVKVGASAVDRSAS